jgi:hypothetical protein
LGCFLPRAAALPIVVASAPRDPDHVDIRARAGMPLARSAKPEPFALSLSKGTSFFSGGDKEGVGFDKLSPNGVGWMRVCQIRRTLLESGSRSA